MSDKKTQNQPSNAKTEDKTDSKFPNRILNPNEAEFKGNQGKMVKNLPKAEELFCNYCTFPMNCRVFLKPCLHSVCLKCFE